MPIIDPPTLSALTHLVREANDHFDGGDWIKLAAVPTGHGEREYYWSVLVTDDTLCSQAFGREWIPGEGRPLDAVAVARRLLAAYRDAQ